ncbi:RnfH family protein [Halomonas sp. Bachu 37]|uniref:RnfH family protein n=1 Tax=Halomonas kashgarensis TaxID=3084920 RepID=UPI00321669FF
MDAELAVEVAFALPHKQRLVALRVPQGTTATQAVERAGLPDLFPELPAETFFQVPLGVFGKALREPSRHVLREGDRVEVYRPLEIDPKQARLARARRQTS